MLLIKLVALSLAISLLLFAVLPGTDILFLIKSIALGIALSIITTIAYPEIRGIKTGDNVAVVIDSRTPSLIGRVGKALSNAKKNQEIRVKFENGEEAVGIVESYEGIISPPKIRLLYEEKMR
jgi:ascorbate-specific PTS system EIIC-type component UlaA